MTQLLSMKFGYVTCDLDGEGYNSCEVYRDEDAADQARPFRYIRGSLCYGNIDKPNLTKDELLELLADDHFMVSNRRSRKTYRDFVRELKHGAFDAPTNPRQDMTATAPAESVLDRDLEALLVEEPARWEDPLVRPVDDYISYDEGPCGCASCVQAEGDRQRVLETMQTGAPSIWQMNVLPEWLNRRMSQ